MENTEKKDGILGAISAAALIIATVTMAICISIHSQIKETPPSEKAIPAANTDMKEPLYHAGAEGGYVVIRDASGEAIRTLKTPVKLMTEADREYFESGVDIFSEEELTAVSEDFGY
ncbi:MAG: hypothetical protein KBS59_02280 [Clostridiales bacterium]|nr:hypothetical protein [Clostridiales bacterium]